MRQVEEFSIGGVLATTFRVLGKNLIPFIILGLVIAVPTHWIDYWIGQTLPPIISLLVSWLVDSLSLTLMQAVYAYGVFHTLSAGKASTFDTLVQASRAFPLAFLASLLATFVIGLGTILLIIPGIILSVTLCLAVPAAAIEQKRPSAALERSAELTRGHRWKVFGLLMLYIASLFAIGGFMQAFPDQQSTLDQFTDPSFWVDWALEAITAVAAGVTYYDLRFLKDDIDSESLGEVFK